MPRYPLKITRVTISNERCNVRPDLFIDWDPAKSPHIHRSPATVTGYMQMVMLVACPHTYSDVNMSVLALDSTLDYSYYGVAYRHHSTPIYTRTARTTNTHTVAKKRYDNQTRATWTVNNHSKRELKSRVRSRLRMLAPFPHLPVLVTEGYRFHIHDGLDVSEPLIEDAPVSEITEREMRVLIP